MNVSGSLRSTGSLLVDSGAKPGDTLVVSFASLINSDQTYSVDLTIPLPGAPPPPARASGSTEQALPAASDGTPAVIVHGPAKLYDRADTGSAVLGTLPTGAEVLIQSGLGGMVLVTYNGNTRVAWVEEGKLAVR